MDQEEMRLVLARAEELQKQSQEEVDFGRDLGEIVQAAEEAGLDREAVLRALQERQAIQRPLKVDDLVFARSADGFSYPARVRSVEPYSVTVKFLNGGESTLQPEEVRRFSVTPGMTLNVPWPHWGWWNATVVSYDAENGKLLMSDGWTNNQPFHISDVRLPRTDTTWTRQAFTWAHMAAVGLAGTGLGMLVMKLLSR
ncbi:MAG: hypothetical protein KIT11_11855 [Fimbriimonadaceae bacterium]|nr:hypothetical protein [Fimbriimonadaceae bacterium]QYK55271.1 MAG: hypothetical protein KF733_09680 [Fimbriimonadaceae bacterium]